MLDLPDQGAAARAGMQVGDRLIAIDGAPVAGLDAAQIHERLGGEVGTWVELTVERAGEWHTLRVERTPYRSEI